MSALLLSKVTRCFLSGVFNQNTAHTHTMETHSMEKVPSMENFSINQTE